MTAFEVFLRSLTHAFQNGPFDTDSLTERGQELLPRKSRWMQHLALRVHNEFGEQRRPRFRQLYRFLQNDPKLIALDDQGELTMRSVAVAQTRFIAPSDDRFHWPVPKWNSVSEVGDAFQLEPNDFDWFADIKGLERFAQTEPLRHYRYRWVRKSGASARMIEAPKPRLKTIQRRLLNEVFSKIPVHAAAHGFCTGRSIQTFVEPHVGQSIVLKMDLKDFFLTISPSRFSSLLMTCGYAEEVARALTALSTNRVPQSVLNKFPFPERWEERRRLEGLLRQPHFPQGAPTSPYIANLCAYRFDCRLAGLSKWAGATYTRYADDMLFSGDAEFARRAERFAIYVGAIAIEEGFEVNTHKTRFMRASTRQFAGGVVLNEKAQPSREEFDTLKAVLHHCVHFGPSTQNRNNVDHFREHLAGRVAYVSQWNPARGHKLRALWERIDWSR